MSFVTVAAATLPSVPLDFKGNRDRILESIRIAKQRGATVRTGPEVGGGPPATRGIRCQSFNYLDFMGLAWNHHTLIS